MTPSNHSKNQRSLKGMPERCAWCHSEIEQSGRGRRRKYCSASCRQRAYEQRNNNPGSVIPPGAIIIRPERASELRDQLFALRCAAEDIATAAAEGAQSSEIHQLCQELVEQAKDIEKLR